MSALNDPLTIVSLLVGCALAWWLAPGFEMTSAAVRVERARDLRPGQWIAFGAAVLGVVAASPGPLLILRPNDLVMSYVFIVYGAVGFVLPGALVIVGASLRPSRRVALVLAMSLFVVASLAAMPQAAFDDRGLYTFGFVPHVVLDSMLAAVWPVLIAVGSVALGIGVRVLAHRIGGRGRASVPPASRE